VGEKLELLKEAEESDNVSAFCRAAGISRDTLYRWRRALAAHGESGLKRPSLVRQWSPFIERSIEQAVLRIARRRPGLSRRAVARELNGRISPTGVRGVWLRHGVGMTLRARASWASRQPPEEQATPSRRGSAAAHRRVEMREAQERTHSPVRVTDAEGRRLRVVRPEDRPESPVPLYHGRPLPDHVAFSRATTTGRDISACPRDGHRRVTWMSRRSRGQRVSCLREDCRCSVCCS
jgi:transposase-like protein